MQALSLDKQIIIFINTAIDKRVWITIAFLIISILTLSVGVFWPKNYEANSTILWNKQDSLNSLLGDNVARTTVSEQAAIARDIILSNKILDKLISELKLDFGVLGNKLSKRDHEIFKGKLRSAIKVSNRGKRIFSISYRNKDPEMSYLVVNMVSQMFLSETREVKNTSSQKAYDFIDRQVLQYQNKLDSINNQIIEFKKENADLESDSSSGVSSRVNSLKNTIKEDNLRLTEAKVRNRSLNSQLIEEKRKLRLIQIQASSIQRESKYNSRLSELQADLDTLSLSYTASYPDIVQLKEQIKILKALISKENLARKDKRATGKYQSARLIESPLYINLRNEASEINTLIKTVEAVLIDNKKRLENELLRSSSVNSIEGRLVEMTRDLDVTKDIYDDLLTRRENARVSLNLQLENQGATFRIHEPATIPLVPHGLRFMHFALASVFLGVMTPLGIIFGLLIVDPRIRDEDSINPEMTDIPILGVIDHYDDQLDIKHEKRKSKISLFIAVITFVLLFVIAGLKWFHIVGN